MQRSPGSDLKGLRYQERSSATCGRCAERARCRQRVRRFTHASLGLPCAEPEDLVIRQTRSMMSWCSAVYRCGCTIREARDLRSRAEEPEVPQQHYSITSGRRIGSSSSVLLGDISRTIHIDAFHSAVAERRVRSKNSSIDGSSQSNSCWACDGPERHTCPMKTRV